MKILVLYKINYGHIRNTIHEHLYAFKKYLPDIQFHYYNVRTKIPRYLTYVHYDGIILHYTFLANRFFITDKLWSQYTARVKQLHGYKVAIPQDEYVDVNKLSYLFKHHNVRTVFTCFNRKKDYLNAYPQEESSLKHYIPVLTGYMDEEAIQKLTPRILPHKERPIDIGYRARLLVIYFQGRQFSFFNIQSFTIPGSPNSWFRV